MEKNKIWFIPSIVITLSIFLLSTVFSSPVQIESISFGDKVLHAFAYFVLTASLYFGVYMQKQKVVSVNSSIWIICAAYGFSLELVQYLFFENRVFEWFDAFANFCGAGLAFLIVKLSTSLRS